MSDSANVFTKLIKFLFNSTPQGFALDLLLNFGIAFVSGAISSSLADKRALEKDKEKGFTTENKIWGRYSNSIANTGDVIPVLYGRMNIVPTQLINRVTTRHAGTGKDAIISENKLRMYNMPRLSCYHTVSNDHYFGLKHSSTSTLRMRGAVENSSLDTAVGGLFNETLTGLHSCNNNASFLFNHLTANYFDLQPSSINVPSAGSDRALQVLRSGFVDDLPNIPFFRNPSDYKSNDDNDQSGAPKITDRKYIETFTIEMFSELECNSVVEWTSEAYTWWSGLRSHVNNTINFTSKVFDTGYNILPPNNATGAISFRRLSRFPGRAATIARDVKQVGAAQFAGVTGQNAIKTVVPHNNIFLNESNEQYFGYSSSSGTLDEVEHTNRTANYGIYTLCAGQIVNSPHSDTQEDGYIVYNGNKVQTRTNDIMIENNINSIYQHISTSVISTSNEDQLAGQFIDFEEGFDKRIRGVTVNRRIQRPGEPFLERRGFAGVQHWSSMEDRLGQRIIFSRADVFNHFRTIEFFSTKFIIPKQNSDAIPEADRGIYKIFVAVSFPEGAGVINDEGVDISANAYVPYDSAEIGFAIHGENLRAKLELESHQGKYSNVQVTNGRRLYCKFCFMYRKALDVGSEAYQSHRGWTKRFFTVKGTASPEFGTGFVVILTDQERRALVNDDMDCRILRTEFYIQNFFANGLTDPIYDYRDITNEESREKFRQKILDAIESPYYENTSMQPVNIDYVIFYAKKANMDQSTLVTPMDEDRTYLYHRIDSVRRNSAEFDSLNITCTRKLPIYDTENQVWGSDLVATRNPVWALADMVRNQAYGAGLKLDRYINGENFAVIAARMASEGRFYDDLLTTKQTIVNAMSRPMLSVRGLAFKSYGDIRIIPDRSKTDTDLVKMFTHANIVNDTFFMNFRARDRKSARLILCHFFDEENHYEKTSIYVDKDGEVDNIQYNQFTNLLQTRFRGITNKRRVIAEAQHTILTNIYQTTSVIFNVGSEGLTLGVGDFILLAHRQWKPCESGHIELSEADDYINASFDTDIKIRIKLTEPVELLDSKSYEFRFAEPTGRPYINRDVGSPYKSTYQITGKYVSRDLISSISGSEGQTNISPNYYNIVEITIPASTIGSSDTVKKNLRDREVSKMQNCMQAQSFEEKAIYLITEVGSDTEVNELHKDNFLRVVVTKAEPKNDFTVTVEGIVYDSRIHAVETTFV